MNSLKKTAILLSGFDNILILTHISPDADCLGSAYALKYALEALGKNAFIVNNDIIDKRFLFITNGETALPLESKFDYIVSVDCASETMIGKAMKVRLALALGIADDNLKKAVMHDEDFTKLDASMIPHIAPDIVIDHHITNEKFGKHNYIDAGAAACGEIIYQLIVELGVKITSDIANSIYAALLGDTGGFRYSNTTYRTMQIASELIKTDYINIAEINRKIFEEKTLNRMLFEAKVIESTELYKLHSGKDLALVSINDEMIRNCGVDATDASGSIDIPRQIENVSVAVSLRACDNIIKVSMRSNDDIDVSKICGIFGGGGHIKAAGCKFDVDINEAKKLILEKFDILKI